ncbi:nucleotidyltransferase domain-containing protein [Candidatus Margulisiibacteriota bacterium]
MVPKGYLFVFKSDGREWRKSSGGMLSPQETAIVIETPEKRIQVDDRTPKHGELGFAWGYLNKTVVFDSEGGEGGKQHNPLLYLARFFLVLKQEGLRVERAVLFGAFAMGTAHSSSDIDVMAALSPSQAFSFDALDGIRGRMGSPLRIDLRIFSVVKIASERERLEKLGQTSQVLMGEERNILEEYERENEA